MKIGIVVDGDAESQALRLLTKRIDIEDVQLLAPAYANMQPKSAPGQIAQSAKSRIDILLARKANKIVVLVDREDRDECPPAFARQIKQAFAQLGYDDITVVVKNRTFENWLIADIDALKELSGLFSVTRSFERTVSPNKADNVGDAEALLKKIAIKRRFHKRRDASAITAVQEALEMARNSRSFRRFLRVVGHPQYLTQSKKP